MRTLACLLAVLAVHSEVAAVAARGVVVVCDRWPDGSDLRRFGADAIRLAGARTDQQRAIAVWRWVRRWMMFCTEAPRERTQPGKAYVDDPIKLLNVYGAHWCDGQCRIMELVWRALGYRAEKVYRTGHTLCDCLWPDERGVWRHHLFDVSEGGFWLGRDGHVLGPDEILRSRYVWGMESWIFCPHLPWPRHRMGLRLHRGERLELLWGNVGRPYQDNVSRRRTVLPSERGPYPETYGNGIRTWHLSFSDPSMGDELLEARGVVIDGMLRPRRAGQEGRAVLEVRGPYVIAEASLEGAFVRGPGDSIEVEVSVDGGRSWQPAWRCEGTGEVLLERHRLRPDLFAFPWARYGYLLRVRLRAARDPKACGVRWLRLTTITQHNVFSLPQLWPGRNRIAVRGRLAAGCALRIAYFWEDLRGPRRHVAVAARLPFRYEVWACGRRWEDVRCRRLVLEVVSAEGAGSGVIVSPPGCGRPGLSEVPAERTRRVGQRYRGPYKGLAEYLRELRDPTKRRQALRRLAELGDPRAFEAARQVFFRDPQPLALHTLYVLDRKRAVPVLLRVLRRDPAIRWGAPGRSEGRWFALSGLAAALLADAGCREAAPLIAGVLRRSRRACREVRWALLKALGRLGDPRTAPAIRPFANDPDVDTSALAIRALGAVGDRGAIPLIRPFLNGRFELQRLYAIEALGRLGDRASAPRIRGFLQHWDEDFRAAALEALGRLGDCGSIPAIRRLLEREPFGWVRRVGRRALRRIVEERACAGLSS